MTILLVDAGNSRLKYTELDDAGKTRTQRALAYAGRPAQAVFAEVLECHSSVNQVTLVNVLAPDFIGAVESICQQHHIHLRNVRVVKQVYGVTVAYTNPALLGADRFVALVAAHQVAAGQACLVIDCGTAVTVDALDAKGQHLGGLILPGLQLATDALLARAQNPITCSFDNPTLFARDTSQAVGGGSLFGLAGAIDGICQRMQATFSDAPLRLLTGGDAERLLPYLIGGYHLQTDLLMQGLKFITEQERCTSC